MKYKHTIKNNFAIWLMFLFVISIILNVNGFAQQSKILQVKGVVTDQKGESLPGTTVVVEGTTTGVITDINGNFTINCSEGSNLLFSFVGYKNTSKKVLSSEKLTITLFEDMTNLDETIIVGIGYGTMRKSDLTGAIASVGAESMKKGVISSAEQLLQGKVAGLTVVQGSGDPAMGASLRLRGGTSLSASNGPLIVVDGIPGVDFNNIHPSEIVSIDVLKDASASAIYGSRGANGVIIVTTNRANKGKMTQYQGYVAIGTVSNHLDLLSADQWRAYVREKKIKTAIDFGGNTDWQKELEQVSISHSHAITFSNSTESSGFRANVNYLDNQGVIKNTKLNRIGASLSAYQYGFNNKLKLEVGINTNFDKWLPYDGRIFERSYNLNPTIPVFNPDSTYTLIGGTVNENPVEINNNRFVENTRHRLLGYGKAELEIVKGLKAIANFSYEYNSTQNRIYKPTYAVMEGATDKGYAQHTLGDYTTKQLETYLTYETALNVDHKINLLAGYSYMDNMSEGFGAERRSFDTNLFLYNNLGAGQDFRSSDVYSYKSQANLISFFGRANYSYLGKYMVTATIRRDGSSRFGTNSKWGLFPSASVAWRISDESFMKGTKGWLDNLKFRAGYGVTGNQDGIGEYKSIAILGTNATDQNGVPIPPQLYYEPVSGTWKQSYGAVQNPNPDLKWESTSQINLGLDFSFLGRIMGTLEVYKKNTSDLLYTYTVPQPPYQVGWMLANVGDLSNKGIELTLNTSIINKNDLSWDVNLSLAKNIQTVEKLSNQTYQTDAIQTGPLHNVRGMSNQFAQTLREGYAVGTFWGPKCSGIDSLGKFVMADEGIDQDLGNIQPKLSFGLGTSVSYKNFDLDISTYGMLGQKVLNATAMSLADQTRLPSQNVLDSYLSKPIKAKSTFSSYWVEDASFWRLQNISIGYTIKAAKIGIEKLRIYATGENLFVLTKYTGVDPELSIEGLTQPGMDFLNTYPKPMTISMGINISF
jgi:TonB-dependent starch-binding outer membrane protein SusC